VVAGLGESTVSIKSLGFFSVFIPLVIGRFAKLNSATEKISIAPVYLVQLKKNAGKGI
jgi:hypothetical protein